MNSREKSYIKYITGVVLLSIIIAIVIYSLQKEGVKEKTTIPEEDVVIIDLPPEKISQELIVPPPPSSFNKEADIEKKESIPEVSTNKSSIPLKPRREIKGKRLINKLKKELKLFDEVRLAELKRGLLSNKEVDPSLFALEFVKSDNKKTRDFGYELMTSICIKSTEDFKPNDFYKAYAKKGISSSPHLSAIIEKTDDDFCREWACELTADIYFHNAPKGDSRREKLAKFKLKEKKIYDFVSEALSSEKVLKELQQKKGRLSNIIIEQWGYENRIPLKMQALISTLDLLNDANIQGCKNKALNIIEKYNFNYDILGWLEGKPIERPPLPIDVRLKKLSDAVFKKEYKDTYQWLPKENGGFTYDELEIAVKSRDRTKMTQMLSGLKKIITTILKTKILIGLGQDELSLLRYFNHSTWNNKPFDWDSRIITVKNLNDSIAALRITKKGTKIQEIAFHIPERSEFVWFVKPGIYTISSQKGTNTTFPDKTFDIEKSNILINIETP